MPDLSQETLRTAFATQSLFEDKTWQLSPAAWPLTPAQVAELEQIGAACLEFHAALETLYLRSAAGKNLLRNKPLLAPWVADYLDRGKPAGLVAHARDPKNRGMFPTVLRPDLLLTDEGFALTELDSVPGGIGLTGFLNKLYGGDTDPAVLGHGGAMVENFYQSLAGLRPAVRNPLIAILVSDEAATYRPEMLWLAEQLQRAGRRVFCLRPEDVFPLGSELFFDVEGTPDKIDILYRFFELFDWANVKVGREILEAWANGTVAIAPPMRPFQEEKLALALFHHHLLAEFWAETLSGRSLKLLRSLIPQSWVMDPAPLPPGAVLDGPRIGGRMLNDWRDLAGASQKERDLIIKISGFHETAWGARSVILGSDCSREEWQQGVEQALKLAPTNLHLLQEYRKPKRVSHPLYEKSGAGGPAVAKDGRLRLCPYYFVVEGQARLSGALATFCPPDKKIIHGMVDAALLPCRVFSLT
ncbi:hypothetical protein [Opitutus sp. GAS368]|uniref:hypothetical protein n=1 Tax=Opitutus sp. GAS368 TaxID=1882749 RepID=UPI00087A1963|nr:hypothetical protein [Opitutus sp. GAS368]SDR69689.1 hypothetical protein SAMN05444173_0465 [Opitutus sp. GAS368]